ncbi:MAG TPA: chitinase, partial [Lachnospiraceae bacterium]|nr:chitinase [Lachnospiraceae bacterium]
MIFAGYCMGNMLHCVTDEQAKKLTHLNIAFGIVKNDVISVDGIEEGLVHIRRLREQNPGLN